MPAVHVCADGDFGGMLKCSACPWWDAVVLVGGSQLYCHRHRLRVIFRE